MKNTLHGTELTLEYQEPTANEDGSGLTDLSHTSIFYDMGKGPVNVVDLPAALNTGGGAVSYSFTVPVLDKQENNVAIWATATDTSGNSSAPSEPLNIRIDRLAPNPPF